MKLLLSIANHILLFLPRTIQACDIVQMHHSVIANVKLSWNVKLCYLQFSFPSKFSKKWKHNFLISCLYHIQLLFISIIKHVQYTTMYRHKIFQKNWNELIVVLLSCLSSFTFVVGSFGPLYAKTFIVKMRLGIILWDKDGCRKY